MKLARVLLATFLSSLALLAFGPARPGDAFAGEPVASVSITVDSLTPALPKRDGTVTVTGRVQNITKKPLYRLQAIFWRNEAPITDREGFDLALESASNEPFGDRYTKSFDDLYAPGKPKLEPGASAPFTLKAKVSALALSPTEGVYLMGVHVLENGNRTAVGRARVFVPVLDRAPRNTLQTTSVVVLNSRPALLRGDTFVDDHLAAEVAPGGRLETLLRAADANNVSYAVDPALVEELQTMKSGYRVLSGDGSNTAGTGQGDAARWLSAYETMRPIRDGFRLLYSSPDIAALAHAGQLDLLRHSEKASKAVAITASLPLLILPGGGAADVETVAAAEALHPAAIMLSDTSAAGPGPLLAGLGGVPILSYTASAFGGGPGPDPRDTLVHLQQRMLADTWIAATSAEPGATLGRVRMVASTAQSRGDDETFKAPWIKQTTLSQLLRGTPAPWNKKLRYTEAMRAKELTADKLNAATRLSLSYTTLEQLLRDPAPVQAQADAAMARAASVAWRKASVAFAAFVGPQQQELDSTLRDGIKISATPKVITSGSQGAFPITVRNTLTASPNPAEVGVNAVQLKMVFTSDKSQRLTVQPLSMPPLQAGTSFTGIAKVEAKTNGTVRVTAQLTTLSGVPVGRPVSIDVTASQAGTVGWFIAIGAGLVLVGTTTLRIRQVTRERAKATASAHPATSSAPAESPREPTPETLDV